MYYNTNTHNRLTAFVRDNQGRPVPEETLTHSHPTWSSDILYHLPPFTTIHSILSVHFPCLTILSDNLSPGPLWSWTLNFILHTLLTKMGVSGWMFLLVPAYPGCPGQTAVKWLLLLLLVWQKNYLLLIHFILFLEWISAVMFCHVLQTTTKSCDYSWSLLNWSIKFI